MAQNVKIAIVAPPVFETTTLENHAENLRRMQALWAQALVPVLDDHPDLIVLPEACDRYQNVSGPLRRAYYIERGEQMLAYFRGVARANACAVTYSAARQLADNTWRNSTVMLGRGGEMIGIYDKNHLVIEENTENGMLYGRDVPCFDLDFGRVCCVICFDLNFEEALAKTQAQRPDLVLFSSMYHGGLMQAYWAYACRAHFAGAVRGLESAILNPVGAVIARTTNYFHRLVHTVNLDCAVVHLDHNWEKLDAVKRAYGEDVAVFDPSHLGAVLLTCQGEALHIDDVLARFDIETLDTYLARSLAHRRAHLAPPGEPSQSFDR